MTQSIYTAARTKHLALARAASQVKASISNVGIADAPSGAVSMFGGTQSRAKQSYDLFRSWVYVSVNTIAKRMAGQEVMAGEMMNASPNPDRRRLSRVKCYKREDLPPRLRQKASDNEVEMISDHPALDLLGRPNPLQRKFEFLYISCANLLITGEAYWIGGTAKGEDGEAIELWAIPTSWIRPDHTNGLFSSYIYQPPGVAEGIKLEAEQVARTYFPDPRDIKLACSPLKAVMGAARIDDYMQQSQEDMFARGINPNLIITIGRSRGADGKLTDRRPVLTGAHRRQLIRSVRDVWGNTVNQGDPAIIDGLIESVHKLQMTPQEMDWPKTGEIIKARIFQAFGVNPIVVGEIVGANRAQAVEADKQFTSQAVNPIVDAFSETLTDFVGPMYEVPERLLVWIEQATPHDADLELHRWTEARKNSDVTRNEFRTNVLNLPPVDEDVERNQLLSTVGGMQGTVQVLQALGQGLLSREQAKSMLMLFLEIDEELAEGMVGDAMAEQVTQDRPALPAPEEDEIIDAEQVEPVDIEAALQSYIEAKFPDLSSDLQRELDDLLNPKKITRELVKEVSEGQVEKAQEEVAKQLAAYFRRKRREHRQEDRPLYDSAEPC